MRVLMIRPRDRARYPRVLARAFRIYEPGLLMIAEAIKDHADITYVDENHSVLPRETGFDLVFISVQTHLAVRAYKLADEYRRVGAKVVLGGPHVTLCPEEAITHADSIVVGPGEEAARRVIRDLVNGQLRRIYNGMKWHSSFYAPDYGLVGRKAILELAPVVMSRGCPNTCSYCAIAALNQGRVAVRQAGEVLADIDRARSSSFYFVDDNLLASREVLVEVLRSLANRRSQLRWAGQITHQVIQDREIMDILEASGCKLLFIGFDSLQALSLRQIGGFKAVGGNTLAETVGKLHESNVSVMGSFMFGMDGDKPGDIVAAASAATRVGLDVAVFNIFTPIPGTVIYRRYMAENRIFEHDATRYDFKNVVFYPKHFSPTELSDEFTEATQLFYSASGILRRIPKMQNRSLMLPLNILYNPKVARLLRLRWRSAPTQPLDPSRFIELEREALAAEGTARAVRAASIGR